MLFKRAEEQVLSQWEQIKDSFAGSVNKMFPISGRKNTLELVNLTYDDSKNKESDIKSQQLAKEQEKTWGIPVFGEFILRDKETGNVINKSRQKIAVLPKMTQRFTYIIGGGEYNSAYQQRIKSGIYSKVNEKGEHLAEINLNGRNNAFVKEARLKIPFDLDITCRVNGEVRQHSNTGRMIFDIPSIISDLSQGMTLLPGDIILTGTPAGVGFALDPPQFLKHGDQIEAEIEKIGILRNTIE